MRRFRTLHPDRIGRPLKAGHYLAYAFSPGLDPVVLEDRSCAGRGTAFLLKPGSNVLHFGLQEDWEEPVLQRIGSQGGPSMHFIPLSGRLLRFLRVARHYRMPQGLRYYRTLWPRRRGAADIPLQQWHDALDSLLYIRGETITPKFLSPPPEEPASGDEADGDLRVGAVVHLHYLDVWPQMRARLETLPKGARIYFTLSADAVPGDGVDLANLQADIAQRWPDAVARTVPNRGRDVGPFMQLLAEGAFDGLDCVCKIHGKKTVRNGKDSYYGTAWRSYALNTLLRGPESVRVIARRFASDPSLGMLGPERMRMPTYRTRQSNWAYSETEGWDAFMQTRFGRDLSEDVVFFAGTMFWFRPQALVLLRQPPREDWCFPAEPIGDTLNMAHILETLLPTCARLAGFRVEDLP